MQNGWPQHLRSMTPAITANELPLRSLRSSVSALMRVRCRKVVPFLQLPGSEVDTSTRHWWASSRCASFEAATTAKNSWMLETLLAITTTSGKDFHLGLSTSHLFLEAVHARCFPCREVQGVGFFLNGLDLRALARALLSPLSGPAKMAVSSAADPRFEVQV